MLRRVRVENFRGLAEAELELDRVNLVLGENGAGKSSLAGAIQYTLLGWCEWTDRRGAGAADLIRKGSRKAVVEIDADFGHVVRELRARGSSLAVDGQTGKDAAAALAARLPSPELLAAMLRSDGLIGLPAKEQQALLFQLAGGEANADWFRQHLTEEEAAELESELATRLTGADLAERLHTVATVLRREAKKELQALAARLNALQPPDQRPDPNLAAKIAKLRQELSDVQKALGAAGAQSEAHERTRRRWEELQAEYDAIRGELEGLETRDAVTPETVALLEERLQQQEEAAEKLREQISERRVELAHIKAQVESLAGLEGGTCPVDGAACPRAEEIESAAADLKKRVAAIKRQLGRLQKKYEAAEAERRETEQELDQARQAVADAERMRQRRLDLEARLKTVKRRLEEAVEEYRQCPAPDIEALREREARLLAELETKERQLARQRQAAEAQERRRELEQQIEQQRRRVAVLEGLVKKLGPDGLPALAMKETIGRVLDAINETLSRFTDFTLEAVPGSEFALIVRREGTTIPVSLLSESEKLRVGAAIQVALARLTGFDFVIVDAADRLDTANRPKLLKMLLQSGVQALVLATPLNGVRPSQVLGLTVFELSQGRATRLTATEEVAA